MVGTVGKIPSDFNCQVLSFQAVSDLGSIQLYQLMATRNPARKPVEGTVVEIPLFLRFYIYIPVSQIWPINDMYARMILLVTFLNLVK